MLHSHWRHKRTDCIVTVVGPIDPHADKVSFSYRGGGFRKSTDPQTFLADFVLLTDNDLQSIDATFVPFKFGFDWEGMEPNEIYHGYTNGQTWNGWAVPYVEEAVLLQWVKKTTDDGFQIFDGGTLRFDEDRAALIVTDGSNDIVIESEWINTPTGEKLVWEISLGFCWVNFTELAHLYDMDAEEDA